MQKKIIALAISAAISAPAFADTNIYGVFDVGYENTQKTLTTTTSVKSGESAFAFSTMTSSRLGITHSEDLNDGAKALFRIETGVGSNPMAGVSQTGTEANGANGTTIDATSLGSRELNASLIFNQGTTIKAGYGSSMIRDISLGYAPDPGGNLVGNVLNNDATLSSNRTVGASVIQAFGNLTGTVQITNSSTNKDGTNDVQKGNGYLLGLQYAEGAISAAGAYQDMKTATNPVAYVAPITGNGTTTISTLGTLAAAATDVDQKIGILAGSYDFVVAKLIAEYANIKIDDSISGVSKTRSYESIGGQVPFGAVLGFAQFSHGSVNPGGAGSSGHTITGYTVGGKYNLSKATYGYASVGETKLDSGTAPAFTGIKVDQLAVGLVHSF